jgi:NHL repeat
VVWRRRPRDARQTCRPGDVAVTPDGALVVADTQNQVIRRIDTAGVITTIAGTGARGRAPGSVSARRATFRYPRGVAVDGDGSVLVADSGNDALRRIDGSGWVTTIAAGLRGVADVVVAAPGEYLVAAAGEDRVVRVSADGTKTPLAGSGRRGFSGDGGPADRARLDAPSALAVSADGLLIADTGNGVVRLVAPDNRISTVAGRPPAAAPGPTQATRVALGRPLGVTATPDGGFVVGASAVLWQVAPGGVAHVLAGTARPGFNTDSGTALSTRLEPTQLALAGDGAIVLADTRNDRVRRVALGRVETLAGSGRPSLRLAPVVLAPFVSPTGPTGSPHSGAAATGKRCSRRR